MRKRVLLVVLIGLLAIPLILVVTSRLEGAASGLVWYGFWLSDHLFKAVPQVVFWILLLITAVVLALLSLVRRRRRVRSVEMSGRGQPGQVQQLAESIRRMPHGVYFKRQMAWSLRPLVLEAARRRGLSVDLPGEPAPGVHRQPLPPDVLAFVVAGSESAPPAPEGLGSRIRRLLLRRHAESPLDLDLEVVVRFVEDGLEVAYDH